MSGVDRTPGLRAVVTLTIDGVAKDGTSGETGNVHTDVEVVVGTTYNDSLSAQGLTTRHSVSAVASRSSVAMPPSKSGAA